MPIPLNINLYIPFKDKKGEALTEKRLVTYVSQLDAKINSLIEDYKYELGEFVSIAPVVRPSGGVKKLYWRFKTGKQKRGYVRLVDQDMMKYLDTIQVYYRDQCIRLEANMQHLNCEMKIIATTLNSLVVYREEVTDLDKALPVRERIKL